MNEQIKQYLEWKSTYAVKASLNYELYLRRFNQFTSYKPFGEVTLHEITNYSLYLKAHYSETTVAYALTIIKNFYFYLFRQGIAVINPSLIRIPKYRTHSHIPATSEDFRLLNDACRPDDWHDIQKKLLLNLLYYTGARISEILSLDMSDIDLVNHRALIKNKKNQSERWIFWPDSIKWIFDKYLGIRLELSHTPPLFIDLTEGKQRLSARSCQRWIRELCDIAKIVKEITPHSFRHGFVHRCLARKIPLEVVKSACGHRSVASTFSYIHLNPDEISGQIKRSF